MGLGFLGFRSQDSSYELTTGDIYFSKIKIKNKKFSPEFVISKNLQKFAEK
jgi:hypothetical protein